MILVFKVNLSHLNPEEIDNKLRKIFPNMFGFSYRYEDNYLFLELPEEKDIKEDIQINMTKVFKDAKFIEICQ